jgi:hypothetical protein
MFSHTTKAATPQRGSPVLITGSTHKNKLMENNEKQQKKTNRCTGKKELSTGKRTAKRKNQLRKKHFVFI